MGADRYLGTEEIGRRLGMSAEWVRRQIIAGRLIATAYRTGGRLTYRILEADLDAFLARHSTRTSRDGIPIQFDGP